MDLATARQHIQSSFARMDTVYRQPLFDEWAILSSATQAGVLAYAGPRADRFRQQLPGDAEPLATIVAGRDMDPGDFDFATEAGGTLYDACMKIGPASFLVCNHTSRAMTDIRRDPKWLKAQPIFFELSEKFRADPLQL